ncbi:flagellin lysine-N-methylase [Clostridium sp.]|uniref:flagellin lysine-N-methylase n=1 Tax=Clostridium sp. TaxID=1506 RepID=UPI002FC94173
MNNRKKLLIPKYMNDFKCTGSACEDTCCAGWSIPIDEITYKKYKKNNDIELKNAFNKNVSRNRANPTEGNYAKIKLNDKNECPFLTEEKLCNIHCKLGEEALSQTCSMYPRLYNVVNKVIEKSATLSCPEVVRLVLLKPQLIEFDEIYEEFSGRSYIGNEINTGNNNFLNKVEGYFWELRIFTIQLLQNRNYKIWERLIILGMFYQKVQEAIEDNKIKDVASIIDSYSNMMNSNVVIEALKSIPTHSIIQMEILKELVDIKFSKGISNKRYLECIFETLEGLKYTNETTIEEVGENYKYVYEKYYEPFMKDKEYIFENYLVNYVFTNLFPTRPYKNLFDNYIMLVIHYAWIKMNLIGIAGYHKEDFNEENIVKLVQSFSKTIDHNNVFLKHILDTLEKSNMTTMPYMAILIKN